MKRIVRLSLIGVAVLLFLVIAGLGAAAVLIDPNAFKPEIASLVQKATGKTLILQGDLSLSFFPRLGITAGPAVLQDDASFGPEPFAQVTQISASLDIIPLLSGKTEISSVVVSGLRLKLAVNAQGQTNWSLPEKPAGASASRTSPAAPPSASPDLTAIALDAFAIHDATVTYTDMRTSDTMQFTVTECRLDSLRVGQETTLSLDAAYTAAAASPITLSMKAAFTLPPSLAQGLSFTTSGMLDATSFSCAGTFATPETKDGKLLSLKGDITLGTLDIDRYTALFGAAETASAPQKDARKASAPSAHAATAELLRRLALDVHVAAQAVTVAKVPVSAIKAAVKADQGVLTATPVTMTVADGPLTLTASVNGRGNTLLSRLDGTWKNAQLGALLQAATGKNMLSGTLEAAWDLEAAGIAWPDASRTLGGKVTAAVSNGTLAGFSLIPAGIPGLPATRRDLTDIRASGTWNIAKGIAQNNDLSVQAAGLKAAGTGRIDIPQQTLHYTVSVDLPTLPELPDVTVLPVVISGPLTAPSYSIDQPALLRRTAKSLLDTTTKTGRGAQNAGEELGKVLGRLFKQ